MRKINNKELKEFFNGIKNHEEASFNKFYEEYNELIYSIAFSMLKNKQDAEDIRQAVFAKIYELDKESFPTKYEASWLYTVTKNMCIEFLRKKRNEVNLEEIYDIIDENDEIEELIDKEKYKKLISKLNDKEKEIVSLKVLADLSFKEISKLVNEPSSTIKWRYYKAMHTLKLFIGNLSLFIITFVLRSK